MSNHHFIAMLALVAAGSTMNQSASAQPASATMELLAAESDLAGRLGLREGESGGLKCGLPLMCYIRENPALVRQVTGRDPAVFLARPETQKSILRSGFRIHYDTTGVHTPAMLDAFYQPIPGTADEYADSVADVANQVLTYECTVLGYVPPPPDQGAGGGDEYDIYIQNFGGIYYGNTTPELEIAPRRFTTYMSIDNQFSFVTPDSNKGLRAMRVTVAHEFFHAIQFGSYGFWGADQIYFHEMSSVWMEDVVFPGIDDYFQYLYSNDSQFRHPEVRFTSNGFIMYSRGVWCHFLADRYSRDLVRLSWENVGSVPPLDAMDEALGAPPYATTFRNAFAEWMLWNYYTGPRNIPGRYYPEGSYYPAIFQSVYGFSPPSRAIADSLEALAAHYHQVVYNSSTLTLALANINIDAARAGAYGPFGYTYLLDIAARDAGYVGTAAGIYVKLVVESQSDWFSWAGASALRDEVPFPNPFHADGAGSVYIPVAATGPVEGTLSIFSTSMERVYSATLTSTFVLGKYAFGWSGRNDDNIPAPSGVYLFYLELPDKTIKGKFALIRK